MNAAAAKYYLYLVGVVLVAVGAMGVAAPPAQLSQVAQTIGLLLAIFGVIGFALSASFGPLPPNGLTDAQQRSLVFIGTLATSLGSINTALLALSGDQFWYASLVVAILGAVGHAIQQQLGNPSPPFSASVASAPRA